jgi:nucleotide-binding universal stress UspA family protein
MKTNKIGKVLIALDYDPTSEQVAEEGYSIACNLGAETILLHVILEASNYQTTNHVQIMGFVAYDDQIPEKVETPPDLKKTSQRFLEKSKEHLGDKTIKTIVTEGDLTESILSTAKDHKVDLIVMGSHSKNWLEKIVMKNVTERVLHLTKIPLLIIPTK